LRFDVRVQPFAPEQQLPAAADLRSAQSPGGYFFRQKPGTEPTSASQRTVRTDVVERL
jgi:hypothetical protein